MVTHSRMNPLAQTLRTLAAVLDRLGIAYAIGGSVASSARGVYRATNDIDVVAAVTVAQTDRLPEELGPDWYAEPEQMREAVSAGRAFNLIHISLGNKIDIFPAFTDFHFSQLQRATRLILPFLSETTEYPVVTAEDILLAKLHWYRAGGEVSERQWTDITAIVAGNPSLDRDYIQSWAPRVGITDLLERALRSKP
jgi:hypothetical protein